MIAVIMAGGEGLRLRPLTLDVPKPLAPIANKPVMHHIIDLLKLHGITDIVATIHYKGDAIESYFGDGSAFGVQMRYVREESPLGTAGAVGLAREILGNEAFLVVSGDALTDIDLSSFIAKHRASAAVASVAVRQVSDPREFGVIDADAYGRIRGFLEKPSWSEAISDTVNTGIYVLEPVILDAIPFGKPCDFAKDVFPRLIAENCPMQAIAVDGYWSDVGSLERYRAANEDALQGRVCPRRRTHVTASLLAAFVALSSTIAHADPTPSPEASAAPAVSSADPCGDTNLLATTDRPTFGTNPCVVKVGTGIAELGYRNTTTSSRAGTAHLSVDPQSRDRIGIAKNLEFVLDTPSAAHLTEGGVTTGGGTNLGTGLKYEFGYFNGFVDGIAAEVVYPTGGTPPNNNDLPSFNGSYQIGGPIANNFGFNLTLGFNAFSSPTPAGGKNTSTTAFTPSLILGGVVAPQTKLNFEIANSSSSGPGTSGQYYGNIFLQHQFSKFLLLDVEAAQRLTVVNGTHQFYIGAGGSIRF